MVFNFNVTVFAQVRSSGNSNNKLSGLSHVRDSVRECEKVRTTKLSHTPAL